MKHSFALSTLRRIVALSALALTAATASSVALAQSSPPPLPALSQQQAQDLQARIDAYRRDTDARVARNEITPDEAARLVQWREWQIAQQLAAAGAVQPSAPGERAPLAYEAVPPDYYGPSPAYVVEPAPVYGPYYRPVVPYYYGPRPYAYWGPSVCAGGFGRHFGGRICF